MKIKNMRSLTEETTETTEEKQSPLSKARVINAYNQAILDGAPEESLDFFRRYIRDIETREKKTAEVA